MERRKFIEQLTLAAGGSLILPYPIHANLLGRQLTWKRFLVSEVISPTIVFPKEKRIPLGWKAFAIAANPLSAAKTILKFPAIKHTQNAVWLRITAAIDFREEYEIIALLPRNGAEIGRFDIRFAHPFQPFQIEINPKFLKQIGKQGIELQMSKGAKTIWFFDLNQASQNNLGLHPHLLIGESKNPELSFRQNLLSMNSFSPFGWMGGSVQDALLEMSKKGDEEASKTLKMQLECYLDQSKGIRFESPMTEPRDGTFNSIEDFLPLPAILHLYPDHPSIQLALDFLESKKNDQGIIISGNDITTEGCYTVAYPLAAIALQQNNPDLAQIALDQLRFRIRFLSNGNAIFQRSTLKGHQTFENWGRGVAWYLLGISKTLNLLKQIGLEESGNYQEVLSEFRRACTMVGNFQNNEGLWYGFIHKPETGIDTSATGGIASAFVWGCKLGYLNSSFQSKAERACKSLHTNLTPDGFLTNVSQINRGGEALQSNGYRVISQFGMGLFAQLKTLLDS